jgi:hypothetical protein
VIASGGIYASFFDTQSANGNKIQAGTLQLTVDSQHPWTTVPFTTADTPVYPGFSGYKTITLTNSGDMPGNLTMTVANLVDTGSLAANLNISIMNGITSLWSGKLSALPAATPLALGTLAVSGEQTLTIDYWVVTTVGNEIMGDSVTFDIGFTLNQIS